MSGRSLYVLRHAKSDWSAHSGDHARTLNARGRESADLIGRYLGAIAQAPDVVLTSSARRARETVDRAAAAGGWSTRVEVLDELYESSVAATLEVLRRVADDPGRVLLAGHEPTWSALVGALVGSAAVEMPTAALARVDISCEWPAIQRGAGVLRWLVTPKTLAGFERGRGDPGAAD